MIVIGLTGSIGMGKSTVADMARRMGVPVHEADRAVHGLFRPGSDILSDIAARFPQAVSDGGVDRSALGRSVYADPEALAWLESLIHPRVRSAERRFLAWARRHRFRKVILDIPLLFETHGERRVHYVMVVSAPWFVQSARVMARPGMTWDKFAAIRARQMPDAAKRRRANAVLHSGLGKGFMHRQLVRVLADLPARPPRAAVRRDRPRETLLYA